MKSEGTKRVTRAAAQEQFGVWISRGGRSGVWTAELAGGVVVARALSLSDLVEILAARAIAKAE